MLADVEQHGRAAAETFVRMARDAIAARNRFTVALAGGTTPRRLYELLAAPPFRAAVDWRGVEFFWGDERAVPPEQAGSNFFMVHTALLSTLDIAGTQIHRMQAERVDRDAAAGDYQAEIARVFAVPAGGDPPHFDLVLLGLGADGHTASLFPHTAALRETARWVVPNEAPQPPAHRLTLTPPILNRAANVIFLVAGADKAAAVAEVLEGPADPERLPAQLIRPAAGQQMWLLDRAAASRLRGRAGR